MFLPPAWHCSLWDAPTWGNGALNSLFLSAYTSKVWMHTPQKACPLSVKDEFTVPRLPLLAGVLDDKDLVGVGVENQIDVTVPVALPLGNRQFNQVVVAEMLLRPPPLAGR